ncbi:MAG: 30S ribosomal protein S20 [bacterium]
MPITSSAKKALRVAKKKAIFNTRRSNDMEAALKSIKKLVTANKIKEAEKMLPEVYATIDKAVKIKFIKKNAGARYKSRITIFLNKAKTKK